MIGINHLKKYLIKIHNSKKKLKLFKAIDKSKHIVS